MKKKKCSFGFLLTCFIYLSGFDLFNMSLMVSFEICSEPSQRNYIKWDNFCVINREAVFKKHLSVATSVNKFL